MENTQDSNAASGSLDRLVRRLVELAKREHYNCAEDAWYGCPLSQDGCLNDGVPQDKCNCGVIEHNAEVDHIRKDIESILAKSLNDEK